MAQPFTIPYRPLLGDDAPRPYLIMHVTGTNGRSGPVVGLVDSGADVTTFPLPYASLMGYTSETLSETHTKHAAGTATAYLAKQPSTMIVPRFRLRLSASNRCSSMVPNWSFGDDETSWRGST